MCGRPLRACQLSCWAVWKWPAAGVQTHTMEGPRGDRGVAFLTLADLFRIAAARRVESDFDISVSMLEARLCMAYKPLTPALIPLEHVDMAGILCITVTMLEAVPRGVLPGIPCRYARHN